MAMAQYIYDASCDTRVRDTGQPETTVVGEDE